MAGLDTWLRLTRAGFVLLRYDALLPKETEHLLLPVPRCFAGLARALFTKKSHLRPGERYAKAFQHLGPAFIKLGQVLSTRGDIFGERFITDLAHLKDNLPPFSKDIAKQSVFDALGRPLDDMFTEFGDVIGSASIAQAHEAWLKGGRHVAVKILRPDIETVVARGIAMMRLGAGLVAFFFPSARRLEPQAFVGTVAQSLLLELDLRLEASACDEIGQIINQEPWMRAPAVVWHFVARRVLVTDWAPGTPLSRPVALGLPGLDHKELADNLIRAFLSQALDHGVFHADLHEGNLFVAAPAAITAIDFGIIGRLRPKERRYLAEMLWGFLRRDYKRVAEVHFEAGYVPRQHNVSAFAQAIRAIGEPIHGQPAETISMAKLLTLLFEVTELFDMATRPELILLQKTMVVVEGVARTLDPAFNMWKTAEPVVGGWIAGNLGPRGLLADARDGGKAMLALIRQAPELAARTERLSREIDLMAEHGLRFDEATARAIGKAEARYNRSGRVALWVIALTLVYIAWQLH